jgi:hypothetical protein
VKITVGLGLAVPGDPLENIHVTESVLFVMKGGQMILRSQS